MKLNHLTAAVTLALSLFASGAQAQDAAKLNDLEIAHVAYTADNADIRYAHLALAKSKNPAVRKFAQSMISDHNKVNELALALLKKLNVQPKDNFLSKAINARADKLVAEMSKLEGKAFDQRYAENELAYHREVIELVGEKFIPNIENAEVKALFVQGNEIFKAHEKHAAMMVEAVK